MRVTLYFYLICLLLAFIPSVQGQSISGHTHRHLEQSHILDPYENLEQWLGRSSRLKDQIRVSHGLLPAQEKTPLNPLYADEIDFDGYSAQGITLETLPGFYLTGTLYKPEGAGPFPAILSPHGHWSAGRFEDTSLASVPGRAIHLAQQGYVVFSYSMIGYNELENIFPHRFDDQAHQLWGFSAAGLQTWNSLRSLDFISKRSFVDADKIGMTGASGGATQTFVLAAIDNRIRVAAPVNMISASFQGGCICENAPALRLNTNNVELGALMAPRPLLMISTSGDWTSDTPNTEFPAVQDIFALYGMEDRVKNVHMDFPHNFNRESRNAMYSWFDQWLAGKEKSTKEETVNIPNTKLLQAPAPPDTRSLEEVFAYYSSTEKQLLRERRPTSWASLNDYRKLYGTSLKHVLSNTANPVEASLKIFLPAQRSSATEAHLIVHGTRVGDQAKAIQLAQELSNAGSLVALVNPFEQIPDRIPPDSINYWTTYNPAIAALRIQVILDAVQQLSNREDARGINLRGIGQAGPSTLLARSQLPFIKHTHVDFEGRAFSKDSDFLETLYIPLIRKAGDFRSATSLIFPASLTIENLPDGELRDWIEQLYATFNAGDMLTFLP